MRTYYYFAKYTIHMMKTVKQSPPLAALFVKSYKFDRIIAECLTSVPLCAIIASTQ